MRLPRGDFERFLLEAVDEGLSSLGESSKQAVYYHLEKGFKIKKHEIPNNVEDFEKAIEKIFGMGASFLEILIMKRLFEKVGRTVQWRRSADFTFTEYVAAVKRSFLDDKGTKKTAEELVQC